MEYRKFGSIFLLFVLLGFCLYGSRMSMTKSEISVSSAQTEQAGTEYIIIEETGALAKAAVDDLIDKEYEYDLSEIECGQGKTAQVERMYYPQENKAEFRVTSDWLNYTAKLHSRESEESADTLILTMDLEIAQYGKGPKSQQIEWKVNSDKMDYSIFYGTKAVDLICPDFQDANRDGCLDLLVVNGFTSHESWHTIYVWDKIYEEYVQVRIDGEESDRIASDPKFYNGCLEQWSTVGFYTQRFERFLWEGNELVSDEIMEFGDRYDAEDGEMKYVAETTYMGKDHKTITYGSLSFDLDNPAAYLTSIIEEEDKTTFAVQDYFYKLDGVYDVWKEVTYIFSKEPDLTIANYQEAMQYFEDRFACRYFASLSCPENIGVGDICALYTAKPEDSAGKSYRLVKIMGEEGFYLIETSMDRMTDRQLLRNSSVSYAGYTYEYEYEVSEIECGEGYTARVEEAYFPEEHRKEYRVTSDSLNYIAKVQHRADEGDAYKHYFTMDIEITRGEGRIKTQQIQWICEGVDRSTFIYPEFLDADWDGCPDLSICEIVTAYNGGLCRIYVWDENKEEYVRAAIDNPEIEDHIAADVLPVYSEGCLEQWYSLGFYEKHYQRFRWDGSEFVLIEQIVYVYDEELNDYVEREHYIKQE